MPYYREPTCGYRIGCATIRVSHERTNEHAHSRASDRLKCERSTSHGTHHHRTARHRSRYRGRSHHRWLRGQRRVQPGSRRDRDAQGEVRIPRDPLRGWDREHDRCHPRQAIPDQRDAERWRDCRGPRASGTSDRCDRRDAGRFAGVRIVRVRDHRGHARRARVRAHASDRRHWPARQARVRCPHRPVRCRHRRRAGAPQPVAPRPRRTIAAAGNASSGVIVPSARPGGVHRARGTC